MSQQHEEQPHVTDGLPDDGQQALSALRDIWQAKNQSSADIDASCGNNDICPSMAGVGFDGLADELERSSGTSVGGDVRSAWKAKLEREGKRTAETGSVRDLIFGSKDKK